MSDPATLITVLEINDSLALTLAQAALEDAGIEYAVRAEDPRHSESFEVHRAGTPMWKCHCWILVAPEDAGKTWSPISKAPDSAF